MSSNLLFTLIYFYNKHVILYLQVFDTPFVKTKKKVFDKPFFLQDIQLLFIY